jgi:hypothetical protein
MKIALSSRQEEHMRNLAIAIFTSLIGCGGAPTQVTATSSGEPVVELQHAYFGLFVGTAFNVVVSGPPLNCDAKMIPLNERVEIDVVPQHAGPNVIPPGNTLLYAEGGALSGVGSGTVTVHSLPRLTRTDLGWHVDGALVGELDETLDGDLTTATPPPGTAETVVRGPFSAAYCPELSIDAIE